jgi:hypothetical protein
MDMTEEELLEDPECLAKLEADPANLPFKDKRGANRDPLPQRLNLGPTGPIGSGVIRYALFRFADSVIAGDYAFPAVEAILRREPPKTYGHTPGQPLIPSGKATVEATIDVVSRMDNSYLFVQGPPGAGKTYSGKHFIVALLRAGKRIGVTSNSHKPIHHLLLEVVKQAQSEGFGFAGAKKASNGSPDSQFEGPLVTNLYTNDDVWAAGAQLIAGTAWLFSDPAATQALDYLFVDEAGQVALANLVAMGTSARDGVAASGASARHARCGPLGCVGIDVRLPDAIEAVPHASTRDRNSAGRGHNDCTAAPVRGNARTRTDGRDGRPLARLLGRTPEDDAGRRTVQARRRRVP